MPSETLWQIEAQTVAKHLVLKYYLEGWLPILGRWQGRLLYIDGFAGPGEYVGGEPGSPLVALDCVKRYKTADSQSGVEVVLLFIESKRDRAEHLRRRLKRERWPADTHCEVLQGTFDDNVSGLLNNIRQQNLALAPAFVMIDPFGVKGSRIDLIGEILQNQRSECMISFLYEPIRRFQERPEFEPHLNELFGTRDWRKCFDMAEEGERKLYLHCLFKRQLKKHGAKYVVFFELWNGKRHVYSIYFTTGHPKGCDLMKRAIWRAEPSGSYRLSGYAGSRRMLFDASTEPLAKQLRERFGGRSTPIEDIEAFVMSDETIFHKGHLRRKTLGTLEREGRISVNRPQGGQGFANDKGIKVRFH